MSKSSQRTPIASLAGKVLVSAYMFSDEVDAHGLVLKLNDGSEVSIEFNYDIRLGAEVIHYTWEDGETVAIETLRSES